MSERVDGVLKASLDTSQAHSGNRFYIWRLVSRRWIFKTVFVLFVMGVMVRLGIWQLDRLEQRREFNARVFSQVSQPEIRITGETDFSELAKMEYRQAVVAGEYDHAQEVALRNQAWENQIGVHLLTPLRIEGSDRAILVDRGWVPVEDFNDTSWEDFSEPGLVEVHGVIRASQSEPDFGSRSDPLLSQGDKLKVWYFANVERIDEQVSYSLLPVYVQQEPDSSWIELPYRDQPDLDLSEGPHFGYAIQWFTFAGIAGIGYLFFFRKRELGK